MLASAGAAGEDFRDRDRNRILDGLDARLRTAPAAAALPVIALFRDQLERVDWPGLAAAGTVPPGALRRSFPAVRGAALTLTPGQVRRLAAHPQVLQVAYDASVRAMMDTAGPWFGVVKARADFGVTGQGITVCVVDTGVDPGHVDLAGKIVAWADFAGNPPKSQPYDDNGHGTHVAGIAAGRGAGNPAYTGVAPAAAIAAAKVLDRQGSGTTSDVMAGIQWCIDNRTAYNIRVLNLSLGAAGSSDGTDPLSQMVNAAVDAGLVAAVAAGNEGPASYTVGSPAAAAKAVTVGAMGDVGEKGFFLAYFSSRGPTADGRVKPDVAAPGWNIMAPKAKTTNGYVAYSGTSMATPFVAGVSALVLQANPTLTPVEVKQLLTGTVRDWGPPGADNEYGAGRLDGYAAVQVAAGLPGLNISVPAHSYTTGSLGATGQSAWHDVPVADAAAPIAVTLVMPTWSGASSPDFDLYLYDPLGNLVASSTGTLRQETVAYGPPPAAGTYRVRVYSYAGSGPYFFDVSAGMAKGAGLTLTSDGSWAAGVVPPGGTVDSLAEPEQVTVTAGPVDLYVAAGAFSDGTATWTYGDTPGPDRVKFEYSPDGINWRTIREAGAMHLLARDVPAGAARQLYFRLTAPTSSSGTGVFQAAVNVVAVAP